jgi:hypothetical protein
LLIIFCNHAAKSHPWIWIIDFDHPAGASGHGWIPAQHQGLKRDNDIGGKLVPFSRNLDIGFDHESAKPFDDVRIVLQN